VEWEDDATEHVGPGLLGLVGFRREDERALCGPMAEKMVHLRIFEDGQGRMNRSLLEVGGALVLVPQFTLYADCRKGRRPGFSEALEPEAARGHFEVFVTACRSHLAGIVTGRFATHMRVHLVNDGPVTILLDSEELGLARE
jgi:D-tyrosyl-tRNA(Tyr) deacylase